MPAPLEPELLDLLKDEKNWVESHGFRTTSREVAERFRNAVLDGHTGHPDFHEFRPQLRELFRLVTLAGFMEKTLQSEETYDILKLELLWGQEPISFRFESFHRAWKSRARDIKDVLLSFGLEILLAEWLYACSAFPKKAALEVKTLQVPFDFLVPPEDREWFESLLAHFNLTVNNDYAWRRDDDPRTV